MPAAKKGRTGRTPTKRGEDPTGEEILNALAGPPEWQDRFLAALAESGGAIAPACTAAQVGRTTVYDRLKNDAALRAKVEELREVSIENVENTLYQCALNPASTTDRIFFLKTRKPEVYGDKLRQDQIDQIKADTRRELIVEVNRELERLPVEARQLLVTALEGVKELTP